MTTNNPQTIVDLWEGIQKPEQNRQAIELEPSLNGQKVTPGKANVTIKSTLAPVWQKSRERGAIRGVWFCLATYTVRITLPEGYNSDNNDTGSRVSLGKIKISVVHDENAQPLKESGKAILGVTVENAGPLASSSDQSVSNSVSQNVGLNIGAFGDTRKCLPFLRPCGMSADSFFQSLGEHPTAKIYHKLFLTPSAM